MWESTSLILEGKTNVGGRDFDNKLGQARQREGYNKKKALSSSSISSHQAGGVN